MSECCCHTWCGTDIKLWPSCKRCWTYEWVNQQRTSSSTPFKYLGLLRYRITFEQHGMFNCLYRIQFTSCANLLAPIHFSCSLKAVYFIQSTECIEYNFTSCANLLAPIHFSCYLKAVYFIQSTKCTLCWSPSLTVVATPLKAQPN
jgi:hypothetical protein